MSYCEDSQSLRGQHDSSWGWKSPNGEARWQKQNLQISAVRSCSAGPTVHTDQQINAVRMPPHSLPQTRVSPAAAGAQTARAARRYSYLHFCILAAFFPLLNCNKLSHNLFHLLAISEL